jgi:hypothetical protein
VALNAPIEEIDRAGDKLAAADRRRGGPLTYVARVAWEYVEHGVPLDRVLPLIDEEMKASVIPRP